MKQTNNDNYDLNASSPKGQVGFEPFRTDKHFYFHFNNDEGDCILFSQAYKGKRGAENGMESIKKNIQNKDHVLLHHDDDLHYFTIKAGNNQEVARSRNFDTVEDMEKGLHFLFNHLGCTYESQFLNHQNQNKEIIANEEVILQLQEKKEIEIELREKLWELENALEDTTSSLNKSLLKQNEWEKEKVILEEKLVLLTKKMSDLDHSHSGVQNSMEEFQGSTYGFRIDFYNIDTAEDLKVTIYQPLSREKKVMKGLQKDAIFEFMSKRLPSTTFEESIEEEFDKIAVTTFSGNSGSTTSRAAVGTARATKTIPTIHETREPAKVAVTVEEITTKEPSLENMEEPTKQYAESFQATNKKVRTIYQMKEMVEEIRKKMAVQEFSKPKPQKRSVTPPPSNEDLEIQQSKEELGVIAEFFGTSVVNQADQIEEMEAIVAPQKDMAIIAEEEAEIDEQTVRHFFPATEKSESEELETIAINLEQVTTEEEAEIDEQTVRHFFSATQKNEPIQVETRAIKSSRIAPEIEDLSPDEMEIIRRFFPMKSDEPRETPLTINEIQALLDKVTAENSKIDKGDQSLISQFFPPKRVEKVKVSRNVVVIDPIPEIQTETNKRDLETVTHFFGKKTEIGQAKSIKQSKDEIVESILSNIEKEAIVRPVDEKLIKHFFGKKSKSIAKPKAKTRKQNRQKAKEYKFNQSNSQNSARDVATVNQFFNTTNPNGKSGKKTTKKATSTTKKAGSSCSSCSNSEDIVLFNKLFGK